MILGRAPADDAVVDRLDRLLADQDVVHGDAVGRAAVFLADDHVLRHVDQTAGQVARVGRAQRGVGQTLARAVGRDEVLEHGQAFFERGLDRDLEDAARRVGHQPAHAAELLDLRDRAARARGRHHEHRVERVLSGLHGAGDVVTGLLPDLDRLAVALVVRDEALVVERVLLVDRGLRLVEQLVLGLRHHDVGDRHRRARLRRVAEAQRLDRVEELRGRGVAVLAVALGDQLLERRLVEDVVEVRVVPVRPGRPG